MRRTRLLLLAAILAITAAVAIAYRVQRGLAARNAVEPPNALPEGITAQASDWTWTHSEGSFTKVTVIAKDFRQIAEPSRFELRGVELRLFDKRKPDRYDRVRSAQADFDTATGALFSEGDVEITMDVPADPQAKPPARTLVIRSSGVRFESQAGKVSTDRRATFSFGAASGDAIGAEYDSGLRELHLKADVHLRWAAAKPEESMEVTTQDLLYKENDSRVFMKPWSKLVRGGFTLEGADSIVLLREGGIENIEVQQARGVDRFPDRTVNYDAGFMKVDFGPTGNAEKVLAEKNAHLLSTSAKGETDVKANRIDLAFDSAAGATLKEALGTGAVTVQSKSVAEKPNTPAPDTRILRSENVYLAMRTGGQEVDRVEVRSPGSIDFVPTTPKGAKRTITGDTMVLFYGAENRLKDFRSVKATTRTERPAPAPGRPAPPPALTSSAEMSASFDPATGALARAEQWTNFKYEEGDRRARSERATYEAGPQEITLTGKARVWDPTGSTDADRILINQQNDNVDATGNVNSTRTSDAKPAKTRPAGGLLGGSEPVHAKASKMTVREGNQLIRYEGGAVLWQGANRITANSVIIDRRAQKLTADGNVVSQFLDRKKAGSPTFTVIKAANLVYTDKDRLGHYTGGAVLTRPNVTVNSREIRAWLTPAVTKEKENTNTETSLDHAFADGSVTMVHTLPDRKRTGTGDHGEYWAAEERMVLSGGNPQMVDSSRGTTRGRQLTWFAADDRLLVDGAESQPAVTNLKRKQS